MLAGELDELVRIGAVRAMARRRAVRPGLHGRGRATTQHEDSTVGIVAKYGGSRWRTTRIKRCSAIVKQRAGSDVVVVGIRMGDTERLAT